MKRVGLIIFTCMVAGAIHTQADIIGFTEAYDIVNWTYTVAPAFVFIDGGGVDDAGAPDFVVIQSMNVSPANPLYGTESNEDMTITVVEDAIISFDWAYDSKDNSQDPWRDQFQVVLNGVVSTLTMVLDGRLQNGHSELNVSAGDVFSFRANAQDSGEGAAFTTITNFVVAVPEPATLGLIAIFGVGLLGIRRYLSRG